MDNNQYNAYKTINKNGQAYMILTTCLHANQCKGEIQQVWSTIDTILIKMLTKRAKQA